MIFGSLNIRHFENIVGFTRILRLFDFLRILTVARFIIYVTAKRCLIRFRYRTRGARVVNYVVFRLNFFRNK
jgi:hypothetical protein